MKKRVVYWVGLLLMASLPFALLSQRAASQTPRESFANYLPLISSQPTSTPTPLPTPTVPPSVDHPPPGSCLTSEETLLAQQLNAYRVANGLASIPVSKSLTTVAHWHVLDLILNNPHSGTDSRGLPCNSHSWSDQGYWTPVCYTPDHAYASGMWNKPREITFDVYDSAGFEIAAWVSGGSISASRALSLWLQSPPHNAVISEQGVWQGYNWRAMGVGMYRRYAVVWFGRPVDPQGTVTQCE